MCVCVCVCVRVCVCVCVYLIVLLLQMKETWDYENIKERIEEAVSVKERGTKYFRVSLVGVAVCMCVSVCVHECGGSVLEWVFLYVCMCVCVCAGVSRFRYLRTYMGKWLVIHWLLHWLLPPSGQENKFKLALKVYTRALKIVDEEHMYKDEDKTESAAVRNTLRLNLAAALLKLNEGQEAKEHCCKVLKVDETNVKAFFRRGQVRMWTVTCSAVE